MCGIAGHFAFGPTAAPVDATILRRMTAAMAARGPDGDGIWLADDGLIGFGHRRLAVIDPSPAGRQPFHDADGDLVITFNGEIYNHRELRRELEDRGVAFRTRTDTEVLLALYRRHSAAMVDRLRGMFAFAIWDGSRRELFMARDPFGIKPLYIDRGAAHLAFASQVGALDHAGYGGPVDPAALVGLLVLGFVPEPFTWRSSIRSLPAGCHLTIDADGKETLGRYADLAETLRAATARAPRQDDLALALADSLRHHLVADVPVGLFLSAGLDSSILMALARGVEGQRLPALTLAFDEFQGTLSDEVPVAARVATAFGAEHAVAHVTGSEFQEVAHGFQAAMDQPSVDGVNTYLVSAAARRRGWKVALSGLGGDELLGGYPSFREVPRVAGALAPVARLPALGRGLRRLAAPWIGRLTSPKWAGLAEYGAAVPTAWLLRRAVFMPWELSAVIPEPLVRAGLDQLDLEGRLRATVRGIDDPYLQVMLLEMEWYMRGQLLRDADWAGMAHGLEIRTPYVDFTLFKALAPFLVGGDRLNKRHLSACAGPALPPAVLERVKTGFNVPMRRWVDDGRDREAGDGRRGWARHLIAGRWSRLLDGAAMPS